ncbi:MAG: ABC transporter substrate-binding protein [Sporichthyaceae bacterium]
MRRALAAVACAGVVLASGCAADEDTGALGAQATAAAVASPTADAGQGDGPDTAERLRVAIPQDVGAVNPFVGYKEWMIDLVYDKLVAPSPYVEDPQPWLASEVRMIDGSTWEVTVRDDVTWQDGEPFTAEDVVFTFAYAQLAPTGRLTHHITQVPEIEETRLVDDDTVRFSCAFPCPELGTVTLADIPILPEHIWSQVPPDDVREVAELPVGTGPYRLTSYDPTAGYRFTAYPEYFGGPPRVDELVMTVIEDPSAMFTALRSGEIDVAARQVPPELVEAFEDSSDLEIATTSPLAHVEMRFNWLKPFLADARARSAVTLALDRQELLDVVALGLGRPATQGHQHPDSAWADPQASTPTDPARAAEILDEAGYDDNDGDGIREDEDGNPIELTVVANGAEPTHVRAAELVAEHLGEVGLGADVTVLEAGSFGAADAPRTEDSTVDFDLMVRGGVPHAAADPTQFLQGVIYGYLWNLADGEEVPYPGLAERVDAWKAADTLPDRREAFHELMRFFDAEPTLVALFYPDEHWAYRRGVYAGFAEARTYGVLNKWSLIPRDAADAVNALVLS